MEGEGEVEEARCDRILRASCKRGEGGGTMTATHANDKTNALVTDAANDASAATTTKLSYGASLIRRPTMTCAGRSHPHLRLMATAMNHPPRPMTTSGAYVGIPGGH